MANFDYVRAYHECARPAWDALPETTRTLIRDFCATVTANQNSDLLIPRAEVPIAIREAMADLSDAELATAARVAYFVTHWLSSEKTNPIAPGAVGWKFANVADQLLRERLGVSPRERHSDVGAFSWAVVDGELRVGFTSRFGWTWADAGLATRKTKDRVAALVAPHARKLEKINRSWIRKRTAAGFNAIESLRREVREGWSDAEIAFLDTSRFTVEK